MTVRIGRLADGSEENAGTISICSDKDRVSIAKVFFKDKIRKNQVMARDENGR